MRTRRLSRRCAGSRPRWRGDAAERDTAGSAPLAEVALLRDTAGSAPLARDPGLPALLVPAELGGAGESWDTVLEAVRLLSHADASAAMLLGYHHLHLWRLGQYGNPGLAERAALGGGSGAVRATPAIRG
jgi:alkylation response protein AidB-like acyl-CoA dehydrogenase